MQMAPSIDSVADTRVRLTSSAVRMSPGAMERFLRRAGISGTAYRAWVGGQSFGQFIKANPKWTLRKWEVLVLENRKFIKGGDANESRMGFAVHKTVAPAG